MKTITQILNEMIINEKKVNELQDKSLEEIKEDIEIIKKTADENLLYQNKYIVDVKNRMEEIIKKLAIKVKKITFLLSIATILNAISIIILNLWR